MRKSHPHFGPNNGLRRMTRSDGVGQARSANSPRSPVSKRSKSGGGGGRYPSHPAAQVALGIGIISLARPAWRPRWRAGRVRPTRGVGMTMRHEAGPIEVFVSYSHRDDDLREELLRHLSILRRQGVIAGWHDRLIGAGTEWRGQIDAHLDSARIILLLVSANFLASDYCY